MTYTAAGSQVDVIASVDPAVVVLGGAGTGKTSTAVAAAQAHLRRADDQHATARRTAMIAGRRTRLPPQARALFLSFSRTAVTQVVDRASTVIGTYLQRVDIFTFHGFAWRIINDFGQYRGYMPPLTVIGTANSLVPGAPSGLTYNELLPAAIDILGMPDVAEHYDTRYGLVICDEFQDTDDTEWAFLRLVAPGARRIFLADPNQCIYSGFKKIDPVARIERALSLPGAVSIPLPPASHRDPTGVLPAAADAARQRDFDHPAIHHAVSASRITVTRATADTSHASVIEIIRQARRQRRTVSVFTHTIAATATLSDALARAGLTHEQIGFDEAFGEAVAAQLALLQFALALPSTPIRRALAVYITANVRQRGKLSPFAIQVLYGGSPPLDHVLQLLTGDLREAGGATPDLDRLAGIITDAYARLGAPHGQETWINAAQHTRTAIRRLAAGQTLEAVADELQYVKANVIAGAGNRSQKSVQVMNLHQTKGREADTTILLLQPGDKEYHGRESEPFPDGSKLLYVVMTRARHHAHIVVPESVHPLWEPLVAVCESVKAGAAPIAESSFR